ncbi:MAG: hypothetical protein Q7S52_00845 [bacterium]|nr:hypothetical protein [bacterium]
MFKFLALCITLIAFSGGIPETAVAQESTQGRAAQKAMSNASGKIVLRSIEFMGKKDGIDTAVGYATVALDIARGSEDKKLIAHIEKLLYVMRAINLLETAMSFEAESMAVPEMKALACRMASEAPKELEETIAKHFGQHCTAI